MLCNGYLIPQFMITLGYEDGYDDSERPYRSGRVAGRNTAPPRFMEEFCEVRDEPKRNPDYPYRTICGECNNLE